MARLEQSLGLLGPELIDGGGTYSGIGVFPAGLWTQFLEESHRFCAQT